MFCLARRSDGCMMAPITLALPQTTNASSGLSVLMPTRPWQMTASCAAPRCHRASPSISNWPGLEACGRSDGFDYKTRTSVCVCVVTTDFKFIAVTLTMILSDTRAVMRKVSSCPAAAYRPTTIWKYLDTNTWLACSSKCALMHKVTHSPLIRVWFAFFPHVVGRRLAEVQTAKCHLGDFTTGQIDPGGEYLTEKITFSLNIYHNLICLNIHFAKTGIKSCWSIVSQ